MLEQLEALWQNAVSKSNGSWITIFPPLPKWAFLCWLADHKGILLHGSGNAHITLFQPRAPHDNSADDFSKQTAVFAASDGIWPIFYAILERSRYQLRMLNGALKFELEDGKLSNMRYFFSITGEVLERFPWRDGTVYILPSEGFTQQPPYDLAGRRVHEPHWANLQPVRPLAKLPVSPADFPLLKDVRGHDDETIMARARRDPSGFPWLTPDEIEE